MRDQAKDRAQQAYAWMEANVATAILVTGGLSTLLTIGAVTLLGVYGNATYVTKTACTKDPAGKECATIRQEVAQAEPLENTCVGFQRADREGRLLRLTRCGGLGKPEDSAATGSVDGGDAQTQIPTSGQQPNPPAGGDKDSGGGTDEPSSPHAPSVPGQSPPSSEVGAEQPAGNSPGENLTPQPTQGPPSPSKGPLAPVVEQVTPPAAAPAVEQVCGKTAAVTPLC